MSDKKLISEQESQLFRNSVGDITPLKSNQTTLHPQFGNSNSCIKQHDKPVSNVKSRHYSLEDPLEWKKADDILSFTKNGMPPKRLRALKRGQILIEATLDLHHYTAFTAFEALKGFIATCNAEHKKCILIIHGKGNLSQQSKPVLKSHLNEWLRKFQEVLAFHSAIPKHGGTGALYVLLKRKKIHEK